MYNVEFKYISGRKRKLGDYRYDRKLARHQITVNDDLHLPLKTLTTIHEIAHLVCFEKNGKSVKAHGNEWKQEFKLLLAEALTKKPSLDIQISLEKALLKPRATHLVEKPLNKYTNTVNDIGFGQKFKLIGSNKIFIKGAKRRTRYSCQLINSNKQYSVAADAEVLNINP
tara:strand:- start:82 stop:591 length:510 start_codon:yes stop_codon:yes gene_type:complete